MCLGWKFREFSHVLAAAESMGCLEEFLQNYKGNKTCPNFTAAVTHGGKELERNLEVKQNVRVLLVYICRLEIETVIDTFVTHEPTEIHTTVSTRIIVETRSSVETMSSGLGRDVISSVIFTNQIMQLNVSTTTAISNVSAQPVNVNSNQAADPSIISAGQFQL